MVFRPERQRAARLLVEVFHDSVASNDGDDILKLSESFVCRFDGFVSDKILLQDVFVNLRSSDMFKRDMGRV